MTDAPLLFPTQNVTGVVELSTKTRRTFVLRGSRYSTTSPVLEFSRTMRSVLMLPVQRSPFLSGTTSYGQVHLVGTAHSVNFSLLVSSMATLSPRYSANHRRSCASMWPRRGWESRVGVGSSLILPVWASTRPMFSLPKSIKKRLFLES